MPIAQDPQYDPASGYRPVEWITFTIENPSTAGPIVIATAIVTLDGLPIGTLQEVPYTIIGPGPVFTYGFKWDVQSLFQRIKAPKAQSKTLAFGTPGTQYNADATDCYGEVSLEIEYYYLANSTGVITSQGFTEFTVDWPVFIAARQHEESMALTNYVPDLASPAPALWLTKQPTTFNICLQESLFFNIIHGDATHLRVTTYDGPNGTGAVIDDGYLALPASGFNSQSALGVGPNEIRNTTFSVGTVNIDNPAVQSYRLLFGNGTGPFISLSIAYFFNLSSCCEDFARLHWLNRLGGTDAYTFKSLNTKSQTTTSDEAQKPLTWDSDTATPHSIEDKGSFKIDSRAVINRQVETRNITPEVANWLAELLSSPEVYLEQGTDFLPIVIEPGTVELETNTDQSVSLVRFSISSKDANERIIQRN